MRQCPLIISQHSINFVLGHLIDDTNAIVADFGRHTCKFGYSGEDTPQYIFSSVLMI